MPHLPTPTATSPLLPSVKTRARKFWSGFTDFALQDHVLEVAVGLILARAFTDVVTAFVSQILLPVLSCLPFIERNFGEWFAVLRVGKGGKGRQGGYMTLRQALDDGAVVLAYGAFLNQVFNFLGVGLGLYIIANVYTWVSNDAIIKESVKCKFCRKRISPKAQRCVNCTSWQDGREETS